MRKLNPKGFTIIELLIATVTFSVVLLVITGAIIQFTRLYYKGTVTTQTQEAVRAITEEIAKSIQFNPANSLKSYPISAGNPFDRYCIGNHGYVYQKNVSVSEDGTQKHALVSDQLCRPYDINSALQSNQTEMLGDRMQLLELSVSQSPTNSKQYTIHVKIGYGDEIQDDDTCPSVSIGGQFCAVSELSTTVIGRL